MAASLKPSATGRLREPEPSHLNRRQLAASGGRNASGIELSAAIFLSEVIPAFALPATCAGGFSQRSNNFRRDQTTTANGRIPSVPATKPKVPLGVEGGHSPNEQRSSQQGGAGAFLGDGR
jgi:hypothetical protein